MKSTFTIEGMTCSGCAAKVTYTLQQIDYVSEVAVDLDAKQAILWRASLTSPKSQQN